MAKLRPGRCTRELKRPWTRQSRKKPRVGYVKGVPQTKIRRYVTGSKTDYDTRFCLTITGKLQIRDNSIEAARISISNYLQKNIKLNFYLILRKYPFQVLREHKQAAVAGADRFFAGMRHAFGKPAGMAVVMNKGDVLFELRIDKKYEQFAKNAFKRASQKLSGNYKIIEQELAKPKETTKTN
ncbi:MAG: 50S ribosomal protein L16 [Candidatus Aenigmarchaeota archaeon]|nr:50S ribosomal protein L16 [Candidatus Aenigmarchaeota archaeon]